MQKTSKVEIRCTDQEKQDMRALVARDGWQSISDLVRGLVQKAARSQSQQHQRQTEQSQHDRP